jgi:hypothetical protein
LSKGDWVNPGPCGVPFLQPNNNDKSKVAREHRAIVKKVSSLVPRIAAFLTLTEQRMPRLWQSAALGAGLLIALAGLSVSADADFGHGGSSMKHVLLISIDDMHAVDFIKCSQGISGVNGGNPYCPNLAQLAQNGVNYLETSTSKPSDSFPGLMA